MSSIRFHLNNSLSPLLNSSSTPSTTSTSNSINSPNSPSLAFISLNSNTNSPTSTPSHSTFSFRRTSLNLAHRICGRSPSNRSSLPISPKNQSSPTFNSNHRSHHHTPVSRSKCPCCSSILVYHTNSTYIQCPTCSIQWDLFPSGSTNPQSINFTISSDLVRTLRSLALSPPQLKAFDQDPKHFIQTHPNPDSIEKFYSLAAENLTALFDSSLNISSAFAHRPSSSSSSPSSDQDQVSSPIGLRMKLARAFFLAIINGPGGRELLSAQLSRFLSRPGYQIWSIVSSSLNNGSSDQNMPKTSDWAWAAVLFECIGILAHSGLPIATRFSNTSRLLGLISTLPNHLHHHLVWLYKHSEYPSEAFTEKVTETNVMIGDRLSHSIPINPSILEAVTPRYGSDWMITAASRVMSLLFAANLRCKKIKVDNFYNTAIDLLGSIELAADFERWETSASSYALCGYPCLLSIGAKITMLTHEGKRQMGAEARQALVDGLLGRRALAPVLQLNVRRSHLVEDSLRQIESSRGELKKLLKICFVGEDGLDGGGLKKEWFLLLIRQLVGPEYGMFIHDPDSNQLWFNPASQELGEYRLIGTVIGLAIYNRATLDISLPLVCYKKLLGQHQVSLSDLEIMRPATARGLRQLLEWEEAEMVEEIFCRTMVGEYEEFDGTVVEVPLVPDGHKIPVTGSNREEFVERYVDFLLNGSVHHQFTAFKQGFDAVAAGNALSLFQPEEIELVVSGSRERLDIDELSSTTEYENYSPSELTIISFWKYMKGLSEVEERKVLSFITGTDRIPTCGLKLKISKEFDSRKLPSSHTCFNQLVLPDLLFVEKIGEKLWIAMNESEGFGLN